MSIEIGFKLTDSARATIKRRSERARALIAGLNDALEQGMNETEAHLQNTYLRGGSPKALRGGNPPHAVRSGALIGSTRSRRDRDLSGFVGVGAGAAGKYARAILGPGKTTITPKNANHLWIPIADNLNPSGVAPMSPREAMNVRTPGGARALRIFKSKAGNLVAFLPGEKFVTDRAGAAMGLVSSPVTAFGGGKKFARGERKGQTKGKLLFVLKKQVEIDGSDSLGRAVDDKSGRVQQLLQSAMTEALS